MNINKKIIFVIPKYKVGGAENVMITLANELSQYDIKNEQAYKTTTTSF